MAPAELEALLVSHPDIADAGVVGIPDEKVEAKMCSNIVLPSDIRLVLQMGELVCAFVVSQSATLTKEAIIDYVKSASFLSSPHTGPKLRIRTLRKKVSL